MGRFTGRIFAVLSIAVLASTFAFVAVAGAQEEEYPPATTTTTVPGTITVPGNTVVGGTVAVSGTACGPNQSVTIKFNGVTVATATTDANGKFSTQFDVPAGTTPGVYTVTASNAVCNLAASIQVDPASATKLAFTGSSSSIPTLWVGAGLVALGAGLVFVARRRLSGAAR
jgi:LPXTG-motif cell wall-anchored protein